MKKNKFFNKKDLYLYILIAVITLFISLGAVIYMLVFNLMLTQSKSTGMEIAALAASEIDGDDFAKIDSKECDEFEEVYNTLTKYYAFDSIRYIYTMILDGNTLRFVVDADPLNPADYYEEYQMLEDILPAFAGEICCDKGFSEDEWGVMLSSYAPVLDSMGKVVGVVGVDAKIERLNEYRRMLFQTVGMIVFVFGAIALGIYIKISSDFISRDSLTELYNQDSLGQVIEKKFIKNNTVNGYTAVFLNIHNFRLINDKYGYWIGDKVLRYVADIIIKYMGNGGAAARASSDNYIVLVKNDHLDDFVFKVRDIDYMAEIDGAMQEIPISMNCGIYPIREGDAVEEIFNRGHAALKKARDLERVNIVYFNSEMYEKTVYERQIVADFDNAIKNNEFVVYFQPKVDISNNRLCGAEALVRWFKNGKMIPPGLFIPVYEREGRVTDLDFYVCEKVCESIREWQDKGYEVVPISANFSKVHLIEPDFADRIIRIIDKYGIDHKYVDIELTESSGYSDRKSLDAFISRIRAAGIRTSMDDFGSGYASLELLDGNLFDTVKIDKSITDKIIVDQGGRNFIKNILNMVSDINCMSVCEGAETAEQIEFLKNETTCSVVQGYFFDRPLPKEEFEVRLKNPVY